MNLTNVCDVGNALFQAFRRISVCCCSQIYSQKTDHILIGQHVLSVLPWEATLILFSHPHHFTSGASYVLLECSKNFLAWSLHPRSFSTFWKETFLTINLLRTSYRQSFFFFQLSAGESGPLVNGTLPAPWVSHMLHASALNCLQPIKRHFCASLPFLRARSLSPAQSSYKILSRTTDPLLLLDTLASTSIWIFCWSLCLPWASESFKARGCDFCSPSVYTGPSI